MNFADFRRRADRVREVLLIDRLAENTHGINMKNCKSLPASLDRKSGLP